MVNKILTMDDYSNDRSRRNSIAKFLFGGVSLYHGSRMPLYCLLLIQLFFAVDCGKPFNYDKVSGNLFFLKD